MSGIAQTKSIFNTVSQIENEVLASQAAAKQQLSANAMNAALSVVWNRSLGNRLIDASDKLGQAADQAVTLEEFNGRSSMSATTAQQALMHYDKSHVAERAQGESTAKAQVIADMAKKVSTVLEEMRMAAPEITDPAANDKAPEAPANKLQQTLSMPGLKMAA